MATAAQTRSPVVESKVWLIGSAFSAPVLRLLGYSRWQVEKIPNLDGAAKQIAAGAIPMVVCADGEWRKVLDEVRQSPRPPAVIVLTAAPEDGEWAEVLQAGAHYLDVRNLRGPDLFSLLNLLWRSWHKG